MLRLFTAAVFFAGGLAAAQSDNPLDLLKQTSAKYAEPASLHLVEIASTEITYPLYHSRTERQLTIFTAPGGKFRFESRNPQGSALVLSDGVQESNFHRTFDEYTQSAPGTFAAAKRTFVADESGESEAASLRSYLTRLAERTTAAHKLPDETITLDGRPRRCTVLQVTGEDLERPIRDGKWEETVWIDQATGLFARVQLHEELKLRVGNVMPPHPNIRTVHTVDDFPIAEVGTPLADSLFHFDPPSTAKLVATFTNPYPSSTSTAANAAAASLDTTGRGTNDLGSTPPPITLIASTGEKVTLATFKGKPVLIDFWATWCGPCKSTMPTLKKLRERTRDLGLAMVGIDSDDDPEKGPRFYLDKKFDWPDYHSNASVSRAFPHRAIPTTVLLDAEGKIIYFHTGVNEKDLLKAIASLGPDYAAALKKF